MKRTVLYIGVAMIAALAAVFVVNGTRNPSQEQAAHQHDETEQHQQWTCGMHPQVIRDEPGLCPICGMELTPLIQSPQGKPAETPSASIKYWVDPDDPTFIRHEEGISPAGAALVPVYEGHATYGSVIHIDPVMVQNMGIRTATVERGTLSATLRTIGRVHIDEQRQYTVNSKIAGWVERLYVNTTGQQVKAGQPLLELYSPQLVSAQQELLLAALYLQNLDPKADSALRESADRLFDSARIRLQRWDITSAQIDALLKRDEVRKNMTLYAPHNGVVTMKNIREGEAVKAGQTLLELSDFSQVWVQAEIYEQDRSRVREGLTVTVAIPGDTRPTRGYSGRIDYLYPYVDALTQTVQARIVLDNADGSLEPQRFVDVVIDLEPQNDVLLIPADAVVDSGERQLVFIAHPGGTFEPRPVRLGQRDDQGRVAVQQGLFEGEKVVVSAQFLLDSETQLREALRKMTMDKAEEKAPEPSADLEELF
nr:efflux RND transporter periplasmic adaptor subunit [uncultured Desulfuromonas sp.]